MLLYNVTIKIDHNAHEEWLGWMKQAYIPHLMDSGFFESFFFSRLKGVDESDGITYALQFMIANQPTFQLYQQKHAFAHQTMHDTRYKEQFVSFRSLLEVLDHS
ncbi:MAG: DUF4286 family protein [Bacteroidota bacterium]